MKVVLSQVGSRWRAAFRSEKRPREGRVKLRADHLPVANPPPRGPYFNHSWALNNSSHIIFKLPKVSPKSSLVQGATRLDRASTKSCDTLDHHSERLYQHFSALARPTSTHQLDFDHATKTPTTTTTPTRLERAESQSDRASRPPRQLSDPGRSISTNPSTGANPATGYWCLGRVLDHIRGK
jgi:hypothetical protein